MKTYLRIFVCILIFLIGPMAWWQHHGWSVRRTLPILSAVNTGGFSYEVAVPMYPFTTRLSDSLADRRLSDLRLFEDARELGPAHSSDVETAYQGNGHFFDWADILKISASDNSNPTAGKHNYTVIYRAYPGQMALVVMVLVCLAAAYFAMDMLIVVKSFRSNARNGEKRAPKWSVAAPFVIYAVFFIIVYLYGAGLKERSVLVPSDMGSWGGHAYAAQVDRISPAFYTYGDDVSGLASTTLVTFENGRPLGPAHAPHEKIRSEGLGAYSHWKDGVVFSSSDGSDPRTNGRAYVAYYRVFLRPDVAWPVVAALSVLSVVSFWTRCRSVASANKKIPVLVSLRQYIQQSLEGFCKPRSLIEVGGLTLVYAIALFLLYTSLVAREKDTGGFQMNFEYKVF